MLNDSTQQSAARSSSVKVLQLGMPRCSSNSRCLSIYRMELVRISRIAELPSSNRNQCVLYNQAKSEAGGLMGSAHHNAPLNDVTVLVADPNYFANAHVLDAASFRWHSRSIHLFRKPKLGTNSPCRVCECSQICHSVNARINAFQN